MIMFLPYLINKRKRAESANLDPGDLLGIPGFNALAIVCGTVHAALVVDPAVAYGSLAVSKSVADRAPGELVVHKIYLTQVLLRSEPIKSFSNVISGSVPSFNSVLVQLFKLVVQRWRTFVGRIGDQLSGLLHQKMSSCKLGVADMVVSIVHVIYHTADVRRSEPFLEPPVGVEPTTYSLRVNCYTS